MSKFALPPAKVEAPVVAVPSDLNKFDISCEEYREYFLIDSGHTYRIDKPVSLYIRKGGSTHRVVDSIGVMHCVLSPETGRAVLRWKNKADQKDVVF